MIYLQKSPTPTVVCSLWCVLFISASVALGLTHVLLFQSSFYLWTAVGVLGSLLALLILVPGLASKGYAWMVKLQRGLLLAWVRRWLMSVAFFGIIYANRRHGARLETREPARDETLWKTFASDARTEAGGGVYEESIDSSWAAEMLRWIRARRCSWAAALIPLMALMSVLEVDRRNTSVATETYTLY